MNKKLKLIIVLILGIFLSSIVASIMILRPSEGTIVEIVQDSDILYTLDLSSTTDQDIDIEYNGSHNIVTISNGEIFISKADCHDNTCVKTGVLKSESLPIVCLPNHLIIRFKSEG